MRALLVVVLVLLPLALLSWVGVRGLSGFSGVGDAAWLAQGQADAVIAQADAGTEAVESEIAAEDRILRALITSPLKGAALDGEAQLYDGEGLFDYINGAAPIFIERGFRMLAAADIKTAQGGELTCDVYDMRSTDNASAIYTKERPAEVAWATIGDESYQGSMALVFRLQRYYVKLTAFDKAAEAYLPDLAQTLVRRIKGDGDGDGEDPDLDPDQRLVALMRMPLAGAKVDGEVGLYDGEGLFDYINGAAPIFIERGFRKLAAADMVTADGGELTCDVYDMQSEDNAAAIYGKERPASAVDAELGDQGHTGSMAVVFRRGPYYVKLTAFDAGAEAFLPKLAALLIERMP